MDIGERYEEITNAFNSIREDAKSMVEQIEDGRIDTFERISNVWMKVTRGDIASRFDKIKETYLDVTASTTTRSTRTASSRRTRISVARSRSQRCWRSRC